MKLQLDPCRPPLWAPTPHAQTIVAHFMRESQLSTKGRPLEILTDDGDTLTAFVQEGPSPFVIYLFHGLAGSTDSNYMHRVARYALRDGHSVIMMNHRGCGEGAGLARKPYHSGRAEDLSAAIRVGRKIFPTKKHLAVGFSMSANALLLLLSGQRGSVQPDLAIAMNAPIHLESCAHLLKSGFNRVYDLEFLRLCRKDAFIATGKKVTLPLLTTLHEFDNAYTAPMGGFKNREDYYNSCSTWNLLDRIQVPTVVFMSKDDPFVDFSYYEKTQPSKYVSMHIESHGGHMGYLTKYKTPLGTNRWLDYAIREGIEHLTTNFADSTIQSQNQNTHQDTARL